MSDALKALKTKVEAGKGGAWLQYREALGPEHWPLGQDAYNGSLNAARELHEALLPGWAWEACTRPFGIRPHRCHFMLTTDHAGWGNGKTAHSQHDNPARAWLLAILSALIAEGDSPP